jgi:hypothetical protein
VWRLVLSDPSDAQRALRDRRTAADRNGTGPV